jgi:hypothetical protein
MSNIGLISICARFPGDDLPPVRRGLELLGWVMSLLIQSLYFVYITGHGTQHTYDLFALLAWSIQAVAVAGFLARFVSADGGLKQRLRWVGIGLGSVVIAQAVFFAASVYFLDEIFNDLTPFLNVFAFTFTYAMLRDRVADVRFVSARTLIYGALTSMPFALFRGSDWLLRTELQRSRLAAVVEVIVAVGFGVLINRLQPRVDRGVEQLILRSRYRSERRVREIIELLPASDEESTLNSVIVHACSEAMDLASIALFL